MVSLVKRALYGWAVGRPAKDLDSFVRRIRSASADECAQALVATTIAAQWLQVTTMTRLRFPEVYLSGERFADLPEERSFLTDYMVELTEIRKAIRGEQAANALLASAGLVVLTHSIHCVRDYFSLLPQGRDFWAHILKGQDIAAEMTDALFVPRLLAPEWEPPLGWHLGCSAEASRAPFSGQRNSA